MRRLSPWQYTVVAIARGVDSLRNDAVPPPLGFDVLFEGLKTAARVDTTTVTTNSQADATPADDDGASSIWLSLDEASGRLDRSRRTLERRIEAGLLPVHREGRNVYVKLEDAKKAI